MKRKNAISVLLIFLMTATVLSSCDISDLETSTDSEPIGKSILADSTTTVHKTATVTTAMPTATTTEKAIETTKAPIETKTPATTAKAATAAKKAPATTKKAPATTKKAAVTTKKAAVTTKKATPNNDIVITSDMTFRRNEMATVSIKATPNAEYSIRVYYNSGASKAAGLENKKSDANGNVSWTWKIGGKTAPGTYKIVISGADSTITRQFTVIES